MSDDIHFISGDAPATGRSSDRRKPVVGPRSPTAFTGTRTAAASRNSRTITGPQSWPTRYPVPFSPDGREIRPTRVGSAATTTVHYLINDGRALDRRMELSHRATLSGTS